MDGAFPSEGGGEFGSEGQFRGQRRGFRGTSENAKTKVCMRWKAGHCRFGDQCNFAHGEHELRKLPPRGGPEPAYGAGGAGRGRGRGGFPGYGGAYDAGIGPGGRGGYGGDLGVGPGGYGMGGMAPSGGFPGGGYASGGRGMGNGGEMYGAGGGRGAGAGYPMTSRSGWQQYFTTEGEAYYHHQATGATQWEQPPDWMG